MKTFFISDTHFGHRNIIDYTTRKNVFKDSPTDFTTADHVKQMDDTIIKNWNSVVGDDDTVYFLGDFALTTQERAKEILSQLKGHKFLIYGNHDRRSVTFFKDAGFEWVSKCAIKIDDKYILSHAPAHDMTADYCNIHGHIHDEVFENAGKKYFNVSVERNDYTPVDFETIKEYFDKK